jgi:hypothetical protein
MKKILLSCLAAFCFLISFAQPIPLRSDIQVSYVMDLPDFCARVAQDPVSGKPTFITSTGDVYSVTIPSAGPATATLLFTAANHGITYLQGMAFKGDTLFLVGNVTDTVNSTGYIKRGVLLANGSRIWSTVAYTAVYPQSRSAYDHGFSGITLTPNGDSLIISSGSRTDHGEEQSNYNYYPGIREVPLTSAIFRIPVNAQNLFLLNTTAGLAPYLYADGTRNSFDLAYLANGDLFGTENSGDRDDPDELNWIRQGRNYGFPWRMGDCYVPQQYGTYDPNNDICINHGCNAWIKGYFYNDPAYPPCPSMSYTRPVRNLGPDADKFRDTITGIVHDASDMGITLGTFTPHRSPLGLVFDNDSLLGNGFTGDGFVLSFTAGGDASGNTPTGAPGTVDDESEDLLHLDLVKDIANDNYNAHITRIVRGFHSPVDECMVNRDFYVIEHSWAGGAKMWKVSMPPLGINESAATIRNTGGYPNPCSSSILLYYTLAQPSDVSLSIYDLVGKKVMSRDIGKSSAGENTYEMNTSELAPGVYIYSLQTKEGAAQGKFIVGE